MIAVATVNFTTINSAITAEMATIAAAERAQDYDELTEGQQTTPTIQVYFEDWETSAESDTDRITFGGPSGVRYTPITFHIDVIARQRSQIAEDMAAVYTMADAVQAKLEEQNCPFFGLDDIKSFEWSASRVTFEYATILYVGIRFRLGIRIF